MADPSLPTCVLVVADRERIGELVAALAEVQSVDVLVSSGGEDTLELFQARRPVVVVLTASLQLGETKSLIVKLRGMAPRAEVAIIVIGDDVGPVRTALDALDLAPDRFVTRPLSPKALRFAVTGGIEAVRLVRAAAALQRPVVTAPLPSLRAPVAPAVSTDTSAVLRARWEALADSIADQAEDAESELAAPIVRIPTPSKRPSAAHLEVEAANGATNGVAHTDGAGEAEPAAIDDKPSARASDPMVERPSDRAIRPPSGEPTPPPTPFVIKPRKRISEPVDAQAPAAVWSPAPAEHSAPAAVWSPAPDAMPPSDEATPEPLDGATPTWIPRLHREPFIPAAVESLTGGHEVFVPAAEESFERAQDSFPAAAESFERAPLASHDVPLDPLDVPRELPSFSDSDPGILPPEPPTSPRTQTGDGRLVVAARTSSHDYWSEPETVEAFPDREPASDAARAPAAAEEFDELVTGTRDPAELGFPLGLPFGLAADDLPFAERRPLQPLRLGSSPEVVPEGSLFAAEPRIDDDWPGYAGPPDLDADLPDLLASAPPPEPRDFARELRAKMSVMAQRLFRNSEADLAPRHDHLTEIDLAALGDDALGGDLEGRGGPAEGGELTTSPGSWDTQVRERGLPDTGAIVRGTSDAAMLLARMFAQSATGRVGFRRDEVEAVVYFDRGRPVFASSNEPRDRMGLLLLREGKITASQWERCQRVVAESGRRMGEILVDFGYLKRRELLPAVRRHVEDIVYSLFGWDRGAYAVAIDAQPCAERIRLSRHPAALILEGIRRKFDRAALDRLVGPPSTVLEVRDRERLGGIVHQGDLSIEERAALAAFDGQADLATVARTATVDLADVLPLAWGLCVLGLATTRRSDSDLADDGAALVGETDLAIDRERVRARWQLVTEADYFALLGVRRDATAFEIRRAYQSARRDFAADCFPGDLRRELARELDDIAHVLDEAFRVLRDDRLRQTYLSNLVDS